MAQWLLVLAGYIIGACPTAYLFGQRLRGKDIRQMGDGNMGARNAYFELGHKTGILIFFIDAAKGSLVVVFCLLFHVPLYITLITGAAAVAGHNWPVFLGFRGGRGEATTIGILLTLLPISVLIAAVPAAAVLLIRRNVIIASAVLFVLLLLVNWWRHVPGILVFYAIALPIAVGLTHLSRVWRPRRTVDNNGM
jgi:acyl phosphate:glycerol-3-phosphate acyltransferase